MPILIHKSKGTVELLNAVYTEKIAVFLPSENKDRAGFRVPLFVTQSSEVLSNLHHYSYELLQKQIDTSDFNEKTKPLLDESVLLLISVFDLNGDLHFLDLADYLIQKLDYPENDELSLLNKLQIKKRRGTFEDDDIAALNKLNDSDTQVRFGKYVLLEDKENASKVFDQFTDAQKEFYTSAPIYKLYSEL